MIDEPTMLLRSASCSVNSPFSQQCLAICSKQSSTDCMSLCALVSLKMKHLLARVGGTAEGPCLGAPGEAAGVQSPGQLGERKSKAFGINWLVGLKRGLKHNKWYIARNLFRKPNTPEDCKTFSPSHKSLYCRITE